MGTNGQWTAKDDRLLGGLVLTPGLGIHMVYTWSTPCLHLIYMWYTCCTMFNDYSVQTKRPLISKKASGNITAKACYRGRLHVVMCTQLLHSWLNFTVSLWAHVCKQTNIHLIGCEHKQQKQPLLKCWHVCIHCMPQLSPQNSMFQELCMLWEF